MLEKVKLALDYSDSTYDSELTNLINAALLDLGIAGLTDIDETDPLIILAVITFCKMNFKTPENFNQLAATYHSLKSTLGVVSDYSSFTGGE
jgi:hypothetical protein